MDILPLKIIIPIIANKTCELNKPSIPSIQLKALVTPTMQKIVKIKATYSCNMISPFPSKDPKSIKLIPPNCINKTEQLICANNLTHTGKLIRSSIKQITNKTKESRTKIKKLKKGKYGP